MHGASDGCERAGGEQRGNFGEERRDISQADGQDGGGHEELGEGNDSDVGGEADGGGAVEVVGHGEGQAHLHDE